jgi:hypothetical protein
MIKIKASTILLNKIKSFIKKHGLILFFIISLIIGNISLIFSASPYKDILFSVMVIMIVTIFYIRATLNRQQWSAEEESKRQMCLNIMCICFIYSIHIIQHLFEKKIRWFNLSCNVTTFIYALIFFILLIKNWSKRQIIINNENERRNRRNRNI